MDLQELVRTITQEVLERMRQESTKPCVMVLEHRTGDLAARIQKTLGEETDILFFGEDTGTRAPMRYILPFLSCGAMADLATGRASGSLMPEVLRLLLSGTEVETLEFEHKTYSETAPGPLYNLYESYEKILITYGLVAFREKKPDTFRFWDSLVTEKVVSQTQENGASVLMVPVTAKVTPLALEAAKNLKISIVKQL